MPSRIIKESINESRDLTSCSFFAQDLYKRLITYADDYGRFNADPQIMIARLYPRELSVVSMDDLMDALIELTGVGKIVFYTSDIRKEVYGAFPNWKAHQRIRDSKKKMPEPTDAGINDLYLRRFIPLDMKIEIIERDNYKCKICGKHIAETQDARRLVKMGTGMFHFDHIVPCNMGGRATLENLRLTCPKCNQSRKKTFSFNELLEEAAGTFCNSPQAAESRGNSPLESKSNPNPIQIVNAPAQDDHDDEIVCAAVQLSQSMDALEAQWKKMGNSVAQTDLEAMELLLIEDDVSTVLDAMKAAADNGVKRSWPYIRKTLANWRKNGRGMKAAEGGAPDVWASCPPL